MVIKKYKPIFKHQYDQTLYDKCLFGTTHNLEERFQRYAHRNQNDKEVMKQQFLQGNLFEQGAGYHYLVSLYGEENVSKPYLFDGTNDKPIIGHEPDITIKDGKKYHLKCQYDRTAKLYSWTFQQTHLKSFINMDDDELENQYVLFGIVHFEDKTTGILVHQKIKNLIDKEMFSLPMNKELQSNKVCVYYDDFFTKNLKPIV